MANERLEDIIENRRKKLISLEASGISAYPSTTTRTHTTAEVLEQFDTMAGVPVTVVGRLRSWRDMGKLAFGHLEDGSGRLQLVVRKESLDKKSASLQDLVDSGDFLEATGTTTVTKTGERSLEVQSWCMLAKSLRPLPTEHFGIHDEEIRLRKRYLDMLLNPELKALFVKKNRFWQSMREFLQTAKFLELEMPILEPVPGGAEAEPFVTHHNALGRDLYLRISLELPLKKMLVAGYERVFEIGRIFRNEGIGPQHLQDYTQMEYYWAYGDFDGLMAFSEKMYQHVIQETFGTLKITSALTGTEVDWSGTWERVNYFDVFKSHTGLDLEIATDEELKSYAKENSITFEDFAGRGRVIDLIFKKKVRVNLRGDKPIFLMNQPIELEPLAKKDPKNPKVVQRMQILAYGTELGKGFGELNDPVDQRERFAAQALLRDAGDVEAQMLDESYVEAMEYGMPPAAGFGVSERLFSVLSGHHSIRETVIFPTMKDEGGEATPKSKVTKVAAVVLSQESKLEKWQELNAVAHLSAQLGIRQGKTLLYQNDMTTADGKKVLLNPQHAIMIRSCMSNSNLKMLLTTAREKGLETAEFTREMIQTTDDKKVIANTKVKNWEDVEHLGVLVFGDKKVVDEITAGFPLAS